jgi:formate dehydrogenase subunit gamma
MSGSAASGSTADEQRVLAIVERHRHRDGPLIEVLHDVQSEFGCIPPGAVAAIARGLNLSRAEVHGVVTFYHHFRTRPPGRHVLQVCRAESCQAAGGKAIEAHAKARLGVDFGQTTADGRFTLEAVYCLGLCACSPAAMLDDEVHGRVTRESLDALIDAGAKVQS